MSNLVGGDPEKDTGALRASRRGQSGVIGSGVKYQQPARTVDQQLAELWRKWFRDGKGDPGIPVGDCDDEVCFFCRAWLDFESHEPDCIYVQAKTILGVRTPLP